MHSMDQVLDEGPLPPDLAHIRGAIMQLCGEARAARFERADLELLVNNGYCDLDCLEVASREGLTQSGIKPELINTIMAGREEFWKGQAEALVARQQGGAG